MVRIELLEPIKGWLTVKEGTNFVITKTISDIKDFDKRKTDITKTCVLIGDEANNSLLGNYFSVGVQPVRFNNKKKIKVNIWEDDIIQMEGGYLRLQDINKTGHANGVGDDIIEWSVIISESRSNLFSEIKNKELTDIDFSDLNHRLTRENILNTAGNTFLNGYKYHRAWNAGDWVEVKDFKPGIFLRTYWDRIFQSTGFSYEFIDKPRYFDNLFIPYNGGSPKMNNLEKERNTVIYGSSASYIETLLNINNTTSGSSQYKLINPPVEILDISNLYSGGQYNVDIFSEFVCEVEVSYDLLLTPIGTNAFVNSTDVDLNMNIAVATNTGPNFGFSETINHKMLQNTQYPVGLATKVGTYTGTLTNITPYTLVNGNNFSLFFNLVVDMGTNLIPLKDGTANVGPNPVTCTFQLRVNSVRINIKPKLDGVGVGQILYMNDFVPKKVKQRDLLKTIITMFNLYLDTDPDNENNILITTRDNYYDSGVQKDFTKKLAINREQILTDLSSEQNKRLLLKYKDDDKDVTLKGYKDSVKETYGEVEFLFDDENLIGEKVIELMPSPTAMAIDGFGDVVPTYLMSNPESNWRILIDLDWVPCRGNGWKFRVTGDNPFTELSFNTYPLLHHWNDSYSADYDLNFGVCDYYFYPNTVLTNNNLYNLFWRRTISQWNSSRVLTAYFNLTPYDFNNIKMSDKIFILDNWWNILEVVDYNLNNKGLTKMVLISVDDDITFLPIRTRPNVDISLGDIIISKPIEALGKEVSNNNNIVIGGFGSTVEGKGNKVIGNYTSVKGNNNNVSASKSLVIGDGNDINKSGVIVFGDNITEARPGTLYVPNVEVSREVRISSGGIISATMTTYYGPYVYDEYVDDFYFVSTSTASTSLYNDENGVTYFDVIADNILINGVSIKNKEVIQITNASYSITNGDVFLAISTTSSVIYLPGGVDNGKEISIKDKLNCSINNITLDAGTYSIDGASTYIMDIDKMSLTMVYYNDDWWLI